MALKVYRTPIGFHDAYVAARSQKAALKAWGSDADLFARKVAEIVTDPDLTAEPLAHPGEIVRRLRGTAAEQLAAAPALPKKAVRKAKGAAPKSVPKKAPPRPSRDEIDAADAALAEAEDRHRDEDQALAAEERALADRRRALRDEWRDARTVLEDARDEAESRYARALEAWREAS